MLCVAHIGDGFTVGQYNASFTCRRSLGRALSRGAVGPAVVPGCAHLVGDASRLRGQGLPFRPPGASCWVPSAPFWRTGDPCTLIRGAPGSHFGSRGGRCRRRRVPFLGPGAPSAVSPLDHGSRVQAGSFTLGTCPKNSKHTNWNPKSILKYKGVGLAGQACLPMGGLKN